MILAGTTVFYSCQEVYTNRDLDASEKIPVIEGKLTNSSSPHYVKVYYARPYTKTEEENISGARVAISDDRGNSVELTEIMSGYYMTRRGEFTGEIGRTYKLHVELPDGTVLESVPATMPDTLTLEKYSFNLDSRTVITRDEKGNISESTEQGYGYYMTIGNIDKDKAYFRLSSDFYVYSIYAESSSNPGYYIDLARNVQVNFNIVTTRYYECYELFAEQDLSLLGKLTGAQPLEEKDRKYITRFLNSDYTYYTNHNFVEYVFFADVYSITSETYEYYEALNEQLNSPDRIYDPIPNQLIGNIISVSDTSKTALGMFEVSSRSRRCNAIYKYISHGAESMQSRYYADTTYFNVGCSMIDMTSDTLPAGEIPL